MYIMRILKELIFGVIIFDVPRVLFGGFGWERAEARDLSKPTNKRSGTQKVYAKNRCNSVNTP